MCTRRRPVDFQPLPSLSLSRSSSPLSLFTLFLSPLRFSSCAARRTTSPTPVSSSCAWTNARIRLSLITGCPPPCHPRRLCPPSLPPPSLPPPPLDRRRCIARTCALVLLRKREEREKRSSRASPQRLVNLRGSRRRSRHDGDEVASSLLVARLRRELADGRIRGTFCSSRCLRDLEIGLARQKHEGRDADSRRSANERRETTWIPWQPDERQVEGRGGAEDRSRT